jgi:hypothetical protein
MRSILSLILFSTVFAVAAVASAADLGSADEASSSLAFSTASAAGTYAFSAQEIATDPSKLCTGVLGCGGVDNKSASINSFFSRAAADLTAKKCQASPNLVLAASLIVAKLTQSAGDSTFANGVLQLDGKGGVQGGFASFSQSGSGTEALNVANSGSTAVVCGGKATGESALCAANCVAGSPAFKGIADCATGLGAGAGYSISANGTGREALYIYPLISTCPGNPASDAVDLCCGDGATLKVPSITFDACCKDKNLVLPTHLTATLQSVQAGVATQGSGTFTDQAEVGNIQFHLQ